jgi:hypothetical protein
LQSGASRATNPAGSAVEVVKAYEVSLSPCHEAKNGVVIRATGRRAVVENKNRWKHSVGNTPSHKGHAPSRFAPPDVSTRPAAAVLGRENRRISRINWCSIRGSVCANSGCSTIARRLKTIWRWVQSCGRPNRCRCSPTCALRPETSMSKLSSHGTFIKVFEQPREIFTTSRKGYEQRHNSSPFRFSARPASWHLSNQACDDREYRVRQRWSRQIPYGIRSYNRELLRTVPLVPGFTRPSRRIIASNQQIFCRFSQRVRWILFWHWRSSRWGWPLAAS